MKILVGLLDREKKKKIARLLAPSLQLEAVRGWECFMVGF